MRKDTVGSILLFGIPLFDARGSVPAMMAAAAQNRGRLPIREHAGHHNGPHKCGAAAAAGLLPSVRTIGLLLLPPHHLLLLLLRSFSSSASSTHPPAASQHSFSPARRRQLPASFPASSGVFPLRIFRVLRVFLSSVFYRIFYYYYTQQQAPSRPAQPAKHHAYHLPYYYLA